MKILKITGGEVLLDNDDYERLKDYNWRVSDQGYAIRHVEQKGKQTNIKLHSYILENQPGLSVDHIDRNPLNNQRSNLRLVTQREQVINRGMMKNNTSSVKGVVYHIRFHKWQAQIGHNNKMIFLGRFDDFDEAVTARKNAEKQYHEIH